MIVLGEDCVSLSCSHLCSVLALAQEVAHLLVRVAEFYQYAERVLLLQVIGHHLAVRNDFDVSRSDYLQSHYPVLLEHASRYKADCAYSGCTRQRCNVRLTGRTWW